MYTVDKNVPSLFAGDEAWHKDTVSPLVIRNGTCFIPADMLALLDGISVTEPKDDNLLIHNSNNKKYISVLFMKRSAAINGRIVEGISVFRDGEVFYVDAYLVANALGLNVETKILENGSTVLRVADENRIFSMNELISMYIESDPMAPNDDVLTEIPDDNDDTSEKQKYIFVLVKSPDPNSDQTFWALENCKEFGVEYTHFITPGADISEFLEASSLGAYGFIASSENAADELDALNESASHYTRRMTRLTLSTGDADVDDVLRQKGYITIRPDFTANGATNPTILLENMLEYLKKEDSCTILLEDYWSSMRMASFFTALDRTLYRTANLNESNFFD